MREILFRGKRNDNGEWVVGDSLVHSMYKKGDVYIRVIEGLAIYSVIPESVSEFVGLTDKNGTKIFEGDKCRVTRHCILCYGFITFQNGSFWFDEFNTDSVLELSQLKTNNFEIEVIGNIHDNPELLGGEQ